MVNIQTSCRALGFLVWFKKFYKDSTLDTYMQIASNYGQCNYGTVRTYLLELEEHGYIQIENRGKRTQRFVINEERYYETVM